MKLTELFKMFSTENDIIIASKDGRVLYNGSIVEAKAEYGGLRVFSMKFEEYEDHTPKITIFLDVPTSDWLCPYYPVLKSCIVSGEYSIEDIANLLDIDIETANAKIECALPFTLYEAKTIQRAFHPYDIVEQVFAVKYTVIPAV